MKQCEKGHIFDEGIHSICPYCNNVSNSGVRSLDGGLAAPAFPKTEALNSPAFPKTEALNSPAADCFPKTEAVNAPAPAPRVKKEMSATIALNVTDDGISPVRGWLVSVEGEKKGMSFVVHSEKNTIGRGSSFDIDLSFDKSISKEGDAIISYDARNIRFFLSPAAGKNNVYHNNNLLLAPVEIFDYDVIEVGSTKLVFRSFCSEQFTY